MSSAISLIKSWPKNVDPLVDTFPLVNNDIWIVGLFFLSTALMRATLNSMGNLRKFHNKMKPFIFLYHCFISGLCVGSFLIGLIITDWSHLWYQGACRPEDKTFSSYGFGGRIRMYFVYLAFLVKTLQLTEFLWMKEPKAFLFGLWETLLCIYALKYEPIGRIWLPGAFHMTFIHYSNLFNAFEMSRTENPETLYRYRRNWCLFGLTVFTIFGYTNLAYIMVAAECAIPLYWRVLGVIYSFVAFKVYPHMFVDIYTNPAVIANYKKNN